MTKLRKQRRRKVYRHNVNRKRLRNKIFSEGNIACKELKVYWDRHKSVKTNMEEMGLVYDPNQTFEIPNARNQLRKLIKANNEIDDPTEDNINEPKKVHVVKSLLEDAKAPRVKKFRLPNSQVEWITYLMDKYGTDFKAMARDKRNYNQETWKQLRAKVKKFESIPEQYNKYLESKRISGASSVNFNVDISSDDSD